MNETSDGLLATDEPPPFTVDNENGTLPLLIVADHAGKHFPRRLGQLGLSNAKCERHIAWDIGVGEVAAISRNDRMGVRCFESCLARSTVSGCNSACDF